MKFIYQILIMFLIVGCSLLVDEDDTDELYGNKDVFPVNFEEGNLEYSSAGLLCNIPEIRDEIDSSGLFKKPFKHDENDSYKLQLTPDGNGVRNYSGSWQYDEVINYSVKLINDSLILTYSFKDSEGEVINKEMNLCETFFAKIEIRDNGILLTESRLTTEKGQFCYREINDSTAYDFLVNPLYLGQKNPFDLLENTEFVFADNRDSNYVEVKLFNEPQPSEKSDSLFIRGTYYMRVSDKDSPYDSPKRFDILDFDLLNGNRITLEHSTGFTEIDLCKWENYQTQIFNDPYRKISVVIFDPDSL